MVSRVLACAAAVVIIGLACYQYQSSRRVNEVQKQSRRLLEQAEIIKAQEQKIDSQQQIESLQQRVQAQNGALEKRLTRLEGLFRARMKTAAEIAAALPPQPRILRIYPTSTYARGGCSPGTAQPCDVYELGKDVQIGVVLTNESDQPVSYRYLRWWPTTVLEVRDQSGHLLPETEELQSLKKKWFRDGEWTGPPLVDKRPWTGPSPEDVAVLPPHVAAGQSGQVSWGVQVTQHYDVSRPGKYSIIAKVRSYYPSQKWFYEQDLGDYQPLAIKRITLAIRHSRLLPACP